MASEGEDGVLTVEIKNSRPVELMDLTVSFQALAQSFKDYANERGDPIPDNIKLYVQELRTGSIIAHFSALAEQAQWVIDHADTLAGFVANTQQIIDYFLDRKDRGDTQPTRQGAQQISSIIEPVAKDSGAQLNITVNGGSVTIAPTIVINSLEANAIQNSIARHLGPPLPEVGVRPDQLMTLEQVKNSAKAKTGDRGIIEDVSENRKQMDVGQSGSGPCGAGNNDHHWHHGSHVGAGVGQAPDPRGRP